MTRWYSLKTGRPITHRCGRNMVRQAVEGEVRLSEVARLGRVRPMAVVRRVPIPRRTIASGIIDSNNKTEAS